MACDSEGNWVMVGATGQPLTKLDTITNFFAPLLPTVQPPMLPGVTFSPGTHILHVYMYY